MDMNFKIYDSGNKKMRIGFKKPWWNGNLKIYSKKLVKLKKNILDVENQEAMPHLFAMYLLINVNSLIGSIGKKSANTYLVIRPSYMS